MSMHEKIAESLSTTQAAEEPPPANHDEVDVTLIRWMLALTPDERLEVLQKHVNAILKIRHDNPHL